MKEENEYKVKFIDIGLQDGLFLFAKHYKYGFDYRSTVALVDLDDNLLAINFREGTKLDRVRINTICPTEQVFINGKKRNINKGIKLLFDGRYHLNGVDLNNLISFINKDIEGDKIPFSY